MKKVKKQTQSSSAILGLNFFGKIFKSEVEKEVEVLRTIQLKFWTYKFWISQNSSFNKYFTVDLSKYINQDLLINDPDQLYKKAFFTKQGVYVV